MEHNFSPFWLDNWTLIFTMELLWIFGFVLVKTLHSLRSLNVVRIQRFVDGSCFRFIGLEFNQALVILRLVNTLFINFIQTAFLILLILWKLHVVYLWFAQKILYPLVVLKKMAFYQPVVLFVNGLLPTCVLTITLTQFNLKTY